MNQSDLNQAQRLAAYLDIMGISRWVQRANTIAPMLDSTVSPSTSPPPPAHTPQQTHIQSPVMDVPINPPLTPPQPAAHTPQQSHSQPSPSVSSPTTQTTEVTPLSLTHGSAVNSLDWNALQMRVQHCTACGLEQTRTQTVFGVGDKQAAWLIVGEAPGADEDAQGEPFVGRAGKLLNNMLLAIGLPRNSVYIANVLKCRPPHNRNPSVAEMAHCTPFLNRQIELIQPRIILALGSIAAQHLLGTTLTIGKLRGKRHTYANSGIPLVATYHPAYLLRRPPEKRKTWQDLQLAYDIYVANQNHS